MSSKRNSRSGSCNRISATLVRLLATIVLIGVGICPARAQYMGSQPAPPPSAQPAQPSVAPPPPTSGLSDVQVLVKPYVWMPWIGVGVNPSNSRIPSASGTVDFGQFLTHLTWVPFMGGAEFRNGPFGLDLDYFHAPVKAGIHTGGRGIVFGSGTGGMTVDGGEVMLYYRPLVLPDQYLDLGVGVAVWGIDGDISLNQGRLLPAFSVTRGASWADPVIGARYHHDLGNGFGATVAGNVGGFGVGAHIDWQVLGTIDYAANSWIDLHGGFRSVNFTYSFERANATVNLYGPILAATFRW